MAILNYDDYLPLKSQKVKIGYLEVNEWTDYEHWLDTMVLFKLEKYINIMLDWNWISVFLRVVADNKNSQQAIFGIFWFDMLLSFCIKR